MKAENFQRAFLLGLVAAITAVFIWMIRPFFMPLLLGAIFASMIYPLYLRFVSFTSGRKKVASSLTLTVFILVIILPLLGFFGIVAKQAVVVTENVRPWVQEKLTNKAELNAQLQKLPGFKYLTPYSEEIITKISEWVGSLGQFIFKRASSLTAGTFMFFINFAIMLYAMFFFFVDGPTIIDKILYYLPLESSDEKKILNGFRSMAQATIKGLFVIGGVQGLLAGVGLWVANVPSALLWGSVMAVLSMIPNVGSALVWVPACIYLFIKGQTVAGGALFVWCALIVGSADNVLRPILVVKTTKVPELLILVSTLGGLAMLGLSGFILGPVLALLFITIWDIYGVTFKDLLPKPEDK